MKNVAFPMVFPVLPQEKQDFSKGVGIFFKNLPRNPLTKVVGYSIITHALGRLAQLARASA